MDINKIIEQLQWRYAVKKYDHEFDLDQTQIDFLQQVIRLTPSSQGLQPYRALFVTDQKIREQLKAASYQQSQVSDASCLVVLAVETDLDESHVKKYFQLLTEIRRSKLEGNLLQHYENVLKSINRMNAAEKLQWATKQAYIALGSLLFAAAQIGVDANPMEGFIPSQYDSILGLDKIGLTAVVIAAIGRRHPEDHYQFMPKVRKPIGEIIINR